MPRTLASFLAQRPDAATFLLPAEVDRALSELFPDRILPNPTKVFPADETQPPVLGYPVADSGVMKELEQKLDRWLSEEIVWQLNRAEPKDRAQSAFVVYVTQLMKVAENALVSNLLNDYHAIFWLTHSLDLARHFANLPRRLSALDTQAGRALGDSLKYRIFGRWVSETREQMTQMCARVATMLDGEEQRGLQFFRLLQDDVLILTEEFVGPDLRELRSFVSGYLRRDFQAFRESFEQLRTTATELAQSERTFRAALPMFTGGGETVTLALLLDPRFQNFLFDHPVAQNAVSREEREQFQLIARRVREFAVLNQLRRGILWMSSLPDGQVVSADRRTGGTWSRSTRPMDFGRAGVVDPMVHRFGMIYDISKFSETLGNIRRGGGKEELRSYRHMLVFQRKLDTIARRHLLQFEKFLGDGAFYTTRRAVRIVRAAVEIQRFYSEMKRKGFAFNRGLRIAINYGYYRLLPMKTSDADEQITEFYGPGIVELSRLTTGKANKEIEELQAFLVAHGYDEHRVQQFFAPLARGVDVVDHTQSAREYFAYIDNNGHLVNEGIVASMSLVQELSNELGVEAQPLFRITSSFGSYIGFAPSIPGVELLGVRLLGMVALKGLDKIDVAELVPFAQGEVENVTPLDAHDSLVMLLRQEINRRREASGGWPATPREADTTETAIESELVICLKADSNDLEDEVLIGEWDPRSDDVRRPLRLPRGDFQRLFSLKGVLSAEVLASRKESVREMYERLSLKSLAPALTLGPYRDAGGYDAFVLGDVVEKL